jgi:hypothetical protein
MTPVQCRVIEALDGAAFEDQFAALGFAIVFLLANHCAAPTEELERLFETMRGLLVSVLDAAPPGAVL